MYNRTICILLLVTIAAIACHNPIGPSDKTTVLSAKDSTHIALSPVYITDSVQYDTDDPALWINPADVTQSLVIGTDKDADGALYVFDLQGKVVHKVTGLKRPNNVDIAYGLMVQGTPVDIAVVTERETNTIRVYSLPGLKAIDNGGIPVFEQETLRSPMGIALYTAPDKTIYAIVGRKVGPSGSYLWQYKLTGNDQGQVKVTLVRKFGHYSGKKEIESIAVDNELGFVYYSDEQHGVHKYFADPAKGDAELALFAREGFVSDHEGISIYKTGPGTGYILVSNQQKNSFMVYPREGSKVNIHAHNLLTEIPVATDESDGSEVTSINLGPKFPRGLFVAMSNGKVFHYYDWRDIQKRIDAAKR